MIEHLPPPTDDSPDAIAEALAGWPRAWREAGVSPWGVLTDPHGWPDRMAAVVETLEGLGIPRHRMICLGDLVDYGPLPVPVIRLAQELGVVIAGNHDVWAVNGETLMNGSGMTADDWRFLRGCVDNWPTWYGTFGELFALPATPATPTERASSSSSWADRRVLFVHDCPSGAEGGPGSADNRVAGHAEAANEFSCMARLGVDICLFGHTHRRKIFRHWLDRTLDTPTEPPCSSAIETDSAPAVAFVQKARYLINVGAVSENRDGETQPQAGVLTPWWFSHLRVVGAW